MTALIAPTSLTYTTCSVEEFSEIIIKKSEVYKATDHQSVLKIFDVRRYTRQDIETYIDAIITKIICHQALVDSAKKGFSATKENKRFVVGLQPEEF